VIFKHISWNIQQPPNAPSPAASSAARAVPRNTATMEACTSAMAFTASSPCTRTTSAAWGAPMRVNVLPVAFSSYEG
jgi:hypothetical protein